MSDPPDLLPPARVRAPIDLVSDYDVNLLVMAVGEALRDPLTGAVVVDLSATETIGRVAIGALTALRGMARIDDKPMSFVGARERVAAELRRARLLG